MTARSKTLTARKAALALAVGALAGCARHQTMYHWGDYDRRLHDHYRKPQDREAWVVAMREIVTSAEENGQKVPPGLYAEYGYALLEAGDHAAAIPCFAKERELWPESRVFMDKMIQNAERQLARGSDAGTDVRPAAYERKAP